jgi:hypothetical protein
MLRCIHPSLGSATVLEETVSGSGRPVVRVKLDSGEELTLLRSYVRESDTLAPPETKKLKKSRKKVERKSEPISDKLLVPGMEDKYASDDLTEES